MNIHEYQAKSLFKAFNIPVPEGQVATTVDEAVKAYQALGVEKAVVKAQIHAGGRGKGGGVKLANNLEEVKQHAQAILGMQLITHQTGPEGQLVRKVWVEKASSIQKELYISIVLDRAKSMPVIMASTEGGMDIEEVADKTPEKIIKVWVDPAVGISDFQARQLAYGLGMTAEQAKQATPLILNLYRLFWEKDCALVEINPLIITTDNNVMALDAKINFDDNALYRHKDILEFRDTHEEDPLEVEASKFNLNYIKLDGTVACMVNGAGLAMATMDIIKLNGKSPANFLDVGGGAKGEAIENAFRILLSDPKVKAVLINIFGGILRCDLLAEGVVAAAKKLDVKVPIVVRMEGTNVNEGKAILTNSGINFALADGMQDAAEKVAAVA